MASYSAAEFEAILRERYNLTKTDTAIAAATFWKCPGGQHLMVPILEQYHDWHLEPIERGLTRMNQNPRTKGKN